VIDGLGDEDWVKAIKAPIPARRMNATVKAKVYTLIFDLTGFLLAKKVNVSGESAVAGSSIERDP